MLKITQIKSAIGYKPKAKSTLAALGLGKINQSVEKTDTPQIRGMIKKIEYLQYILTRITVIGASYIAIICAVPEVLSHQFNMPFYLGGTSILIVISVVLDLSSQIQSHLLSNKYVNLMKKTDMMRRR